MEYDYKILEEKFKQLPWEIQNALSSIEVTGTIKKIASKHSLKIDQEGVLYSMISYVMLGLVSPKDFLKNFMRESGVNEKTAKEIALDVNTEVLGKIRASMQELVIQEDNTSLERAGGFEIEHEIPGNGEAGAERASREAAAFTSSDKVDMMDHIENPIPTASHTEHKGSTYTSNDPMTEPLVDQLLRGSTASSEQKINIATDSKPVPKAPMNASQPPTNLPTNDPYREAMK